MPLYALTIFLSAFLLFQVQPILAKIILPWFGGSAAVWTVCLLFFQVALLLGYLYAHGAVRYFRPRAQARLHLALLAVSLLFLPIMPGEGWKPLVAGDPTLRILALLLATIGLPYFLLSTTGPLLQAWYAEAVRGDGTGGTKAFPYRLYALSNAGSMLALLTYPVVVEPILRSRQQAIGWSLGYGGFVLLCGSVALRVRGKGWVGKQGGPAADEPEVVPRPGWAMHLLWIALAACSSTLLMAVTNHLSQNVAAIPFLWVLPLSLYLLSFILCFGGRGWRWKLSFLPFPVVAIAGMAYGLSEDLQNASIRILIPLFAGGLFIACVVCHGELARLKPHPRYLTSFYLMISLGGALGGVFVGLIAPHLFPAYYELPIGIAACSVLAASLLYRDTSERWWEASRLALGGLTLALILYLGIVIRQTAFDNRLMVRNFYGALRVFDDEPEDVDGTRQLTHGTIMHGKQLLNPKLHMKPTTYYAPSSGVGRAIRSFQDHPGERVGVIGLGTGTLAAYGRTGDSCRFYEINPLVLRLARTEFSFLRDTKAKVEIALGDARLSLEREPRQNFDVLAVDAFSSDSIPIHLLTKEAFALYFRHLKQSGILAVHVSNRYLDLQPVVARAAAALGKQAVLVESEDSEPYASAATWVLVASRREALQHPLIRKAATPVETRDNLRMWTDDYSNLYQILQ